MFRIALEMSGLYLSSNEISQTSARHEEGREGGKKKHQEAKRILYFEQCLEGPIHKSMARFLYHATTKM